jgi:hypothetical protein
VALHLQQWRLRLDLALFFCSSLLLWRQIPLLWLAQRRCFLSQEVSIEVLVL